MAYKDCCCMYEKTLHIPINKCSGLFETRSINLNITNYKEYIIKARDPNEFLFNYTVIIGNRQFDIMKTDQSLDINFEEFKINLLEMLQQVQSEEMFLKGETDMVKLRLIFYGKSKIKSIIYLTLDLQLTNQKEVFDEMSSSMQELQMSVKNLNYQLQSARSALKCKETQLNRVMENKKQLQKQFLEQLDHLHLTFSSNLHECTTHFSNKLLILSKKLCKLARDVEIVKSEAALRSNSSARLVQSMENLRLESIENSSKIGNLQNENCDLKNRQYQLERIIDDLRAKIVEKEDCMQDMQREMDVLKKDIQQATIILAQKSAANDELTKDLVQANQMIVNFNNCYDAKVKEAETMQNTMLKKDHIIKELNNKFYELHQQFDEYKTRFNPEEESKMRQEVFLANKKIEDLEKQNRETLKINELLTKKISSGNGNYTNRPFFD